MSILTVKIRKRLLGQNQLQIATGQGKSLEPVGIQGFLVAGVRMIFYLRFFFAIWSALFQINELV